MVEKEIIIDNIKIKYTKKKCKNDVVFVFLHGWGSDYKIFLPVYKKLDNFIAFNFPRFEESSKLKKDWNLLDYAKFTESFLDKKIGDKKVIFVAHSFGGRVLIKLLNTYQLENIKQIICIGVPFFREYNFKQKIIQIITKIVKFILKPLPNNLTKIIREKWYEFIGVNDYIELEDNIMKKTFQNIISEDISKTTLILKNYKTDFIWGENDEMALVSGARVVSKEVGADLHIIKNGDHFPFIGQYAKQFMKIFKKVT